MRVLDLYCGAGMAADGYKQAGFDVVGWDVRHQPSYPYEFHRGSALDALEDVRRTPGPSICGMRRAARPSTAIC
jgi:hypothetical protein